MENPYLSREYLMIEAEESIHRLKLAFIEELKLITFKHIADEPDNFII